MTLAVRSNLQKLNEWELSQHNHGRWHYVKAVAGPVVAGLFGGIPGGILGAAIGLLVAHRGSAAQDHEVISLKNRIAELEKSNFQSSLDLILRVNETCLSTLTMIYEERQKECPSFPRAASAKADLEKLEADEKAATGDEKKRIQNLIVGWHERKLIEINKAVRVLSRQIAFEAEIKTWHEERKRLVHKLTKEFKDNKIESEEAAWYRDTQQMLNNLEDFRLQNSEFHPSSPEIYSRESDISTREADRYRVVARRVDALVKQDNFMKTKIALIQAARERDLASLRRNFKYEPHKSDDQWLEHVKMKEKLEELFQCRLADRGPRCLDLEREIEGLECDRRDEINKELESHIHARINDTTAWEINRLNQRIRRLEFENTKLFSAHESIKQVAAQENGALPAAIALVIKNVTDEINAAREEQEDVLSQRSAPEAGIRPSVVAAAATAASSQSTGVDQEDLI